MSSEIRFSGNSATRGGLVQTFLAASMALGAYEGIEEAVWPKHNAPAYIAPAQDGSFSLYNQEVIFETVLETDKFAGQMAEIYAFFSNNQELLGAEFAAVWDNNIEHLYES